MNFLEKIKQIPMFNTGLEIIQEIEKTGYTALFVGGCCRDLLLNKQPKDIDIATSCPIEILDTMFSGHDIGKNRDFGIIVANRNGFSFEIAQFRNDGDYEDGRHPDFVNFVSSFKEDCYRRDLTINSLGLDYQGNVVDYTNSMFDIYNGIVRAVGIPHRRFKEDALRLMRVIRFAAKYNFTINKRTKRAIKKLAHSIVLVAPERIKDELWKMASQTGENFSYAIELLDEVGLLEIILPEVKNLQKCPENKKWHPEAHLKDGTSYSHTLFALKENNIKDSFINMSILFHDIGKTMTYEFRPEKGHTYYRHEMFSGKLIENIARRLKFSNDEKDAITFAAVNHMKFHLLNKMKTSKIVALMKSPYFYILQQVSFCDDTCRREACDKKSFQETVNKIKQIEISWSEEIKKTKLVDGNRVKELTGLKSCKLLGDIIKETTDWIYDNGVFNKLLIEKHVLETYQKLSLR